MSEQASKNPDKTIVERRVAHAGDKSRLAVRNLRAGLGSNASSNPQYSTGFEPDILRRHAKTIRSTWLASIFVFAIAAAVCQMILPPTMVAGWFVIAVLVVLGGYKLAQIYLKSAPEEQVSQHWERRFTLQRVISGFLWASLFTVHPVFESNGAVSLLALSGAIVICGLALIQSRFLKFGVLIEASPVVLILSAVLIQDGALSSLATVTLIVATLVFFQRLGDSMRTTHVEFLKASAERDQLVMELEASRSISEEARRRAEESNLAKSRFLATMSHELRTPLNAILGFSEVMTNEVMGPIDNPHYKEYLEDIHSSGTHLLKLINEILDLSRVEAGRYELNEEATNLAHAAEESQQMIKLKASQKNVSLIMQIQPELPQIWADARAVRQVILNLLSNALKFTPAGGTIWLKVGWTAGGGQYVSVRDTGPGIPEDEIPIVLSSFGQGSIAIKSAEQGTGLGLPIVQALVHMHEGTFDLKSKLREGTEVIATFPKARILEEMPAVSMESNRENHFSESFKNVRKRVKAPGISG